MISVAKFPEIVVEGRTLVWDSRQPAYTKEWVFIPEEGVDAATKQALLSRPNAKFIKEWGRGGDHEVANVRWELGNMASIGCGEPSKQLKIIAVTGTNGKTTTATLIRHLLVGLGNKVLEIGTIGCRVYSPESPDAPIQDFDLGYTTPLAPQLHLLLKQALLEKLDYVVMEASSQGIELGRMAGLHLQGAIFLNLTVDHLDFHGTMESYGEAKTKLFSQLLNKSERNSKWAVVNQDALISEKILNSLNPAIRRILLRPAVDYQSRSLGVNGQVVELHQHGSFSSALIGEHNAQNLVSGIWAVLQCGYDFSTISSLVKKFGGAKGRLERVSNPEEPCQVFVDYAHTPDALEKILKSVRQADPSKHIVCVFGCGGDRDKSKRPLMGAVAASLSDKVIVTADNSRSENTADIIKDIVSGVSALQLGKVTSQEDRNKAIHEAVRLGVQHGSTVVIAGKGHEEYQILQGQKLHFSDQECALRALKTYLQKL